MIKIKYITHASLFIDFNGLKILTDPWLKGPSWGGNIWHFPKNKIKLSDLPDPDIIFISHGHDDHLHKETLDDMPSKWKKNALLVVPDYNQNWWLEEIKKYKFKNLKFLADKKQFKLKKNIFFKVYLNDIGETDSSLIIKDNKNSIFLQTDNIMSKNLVKNISKENPKIDIAFIMPFMTGVYPAFYRMRPDLIEKGATIKKKKSLEYSKNLIKNLNPKYTVPYACDIGYMGENYYANFVMQHNKLDFKNCLKKFKIKSKVKIMNPNNQIWIYNNKIRFNLTKYSYSIQQFNKFHYENIDDYEKQMSIEKQYSSPALNKLYEILINSLKQFYKRNKIHLVYKVKFIIIDDNKFENKNYIIANFKKNFLQLKKVKNDQPSDLIVKLEAFRLRRMIKGDYPMQFLTFHNGGYHCTRKEVGLTNNEKKFWDWISFFSFT